MEFETLKKIILDTLGTDPEKVTPEASLSDDLGMDSLDAVELNMAIEQECGKSIPDEKLSELKTVADILKLLGE